VPGGWCWSLYFSKFQAESDDDSDIEFLEETEKKARYSLRLHRKKTVAKAKEEEWAHTLDIVEAIENAEAVGGLGPCPAPDAEAAIEVNSSLDESVRSFSP